MRKRIVVLGSTGSVGRNVLDVVSHHAESFAVVGLAGHRNVVALVEQSAAHPTARVAVCDPGAHAEFLARAPGADGRSVGTGPESLSRLIEETDPDLVVNCLVGFVGLEPTLYAISAGVPVALANKEAVVTGGELLVKEAARTGAAIIPIDSEHVAISQCIKDCSVDDVRTVYLTASGGALRDLPLERMESVTKEEVLAHPTWNMGDKITVDSATLLNKGLELIEAHWLFGFPYEKMQIVIHPQSVVHSLVEFHDNSILAQMGIPDMRLPILYALGYPERIATEIARSRLTDFPDLNFKAVDGRRYPCLVLAERAAAAGRNVPAILNSANEAAVEAFLAGKIRFMDIPTLIEAAMEAVPVWGVTSFGDVLETDRRTRAYLHERHEL